VSADDAFARLVKLSSHLNVKLRDLATLIIEGHVDAILQAGNRLPAADAHLRRPSPGS
jgi:hypothetical protein